MHKLIRKFAQSLPLQFRVLYRLFLLRIVDFESLSIEADIPRYLGQFAGVLLMISLVQALGALAFPPPIARAWEVEQSRILGMMVLVGLIAVVTWDAQFPDRRDVLVLGPLPVKPRTILFAKLAASGALVGLAIILPNCTSSFVWALVFSRTSAYLRFLLCYWSAMIAASAFLYGTVLAFQGLGSCVLPRRIYMRVSAISQLGAFGLLIGVFLLQPSLPTHAAMTAPENHLLLALSPSFWFFAWFNQVNGSLPPDLAWLAHRAWIGLAVALSGAFASLLISYLRTMRKIVEETDLTPATRGAGRSPTFGNQLETAILQFSFRSLARSRQHRVVLAFYLGLGLAVSLLCIRHEGALSAFPRPLSTGFLTATFVMMSLAVIGLRSVYALPISLTANWVLRTTQLALPERYIAATRRSLLLFAVLPVWIICALAALAYRPLDQAVAHVVILGLLGIVLADLNLLGFYKVPFTCSYLPGKSNIQLRFWIFALAFVPLTVLAAIHEKRALPQPFTCGLIIASLAVAAAGLRWLNYWQSRSAVLYFEEQPEEVITTLRLIALPPQASSNS